jgi:hypothetical protein
MVGSFSGPIEVAHHEELQNPEYKRAKEPTLWESSRDLLLSDKLLETANLGGVRVYF